MSEEIRPALTREQWAAGEVRLQFNPSDPEDQLLATVGGFGMEIDGWEILPDGRHAVAALALYGQPFGFTREEYEAVWTLSMAFAGDPLDGKSPAERRAILRELMAHARSAAEKIAALLPPSR